VVARFSAVAKLEETIRYNELFAGVLAHDLRSPLGAIINAAQLLLLPREGQPSPGIRETKPLTSILAGGRRMTAMIEQLLDFTRARSGGGLPVVPRASNLHDLGLQAVSEVELANPEWTIESVVHGDLRGTWDADRLLQLFINLLTNAGQHGTPGMPVQIRLDGMHADQVRIEIHNSGCVPEPLRHQLFEPFRSMRHSSDRSRGLGLGLFIVREIARGHGGSVEVRSMTESSTAFVVHLPRHCPQFMHSHRDLA
jgi:signal transduction histidine kinase